MYSSVNSAVKNHSSREDAPERACTLDAVEHDDADADEDRARSAPGRRARPARVSDSKMTRRGAGASRPAGGRRAP